MGSQDLALRKTAIPYYANVLGYNRSDTSDQAIVGLDGTGGSSDLRVFQPTYGTPSTINTVRVLQPQYGDIIEANLNLKFKLATADSARQLRIAIGYFSSLYTAQTTYTEDEITASHRAITGRDTPYTIAPASLFTLQRLNLYPGMYHRGESRFVDDAFVVLLCFDTAPTTGTGYSFTRFEVDCTMQMGLS
jgi:hypothetical protein